MTDKATPKQMIAAIIVLVLVGVSCKIAWAVYAYGDWTCAMAECRKIKP